MMPGKINSSFLLDDNSFITRLAFAVTKTGWTTSFHEALRRSFLIVVAE